MNAYMKTIAGAVLLGNLSAHAADSLPSDVERFIERRKACDYHRGEIPEPENAVRFQEVLRQIELSCRGTDRQLARLKKKYSRNAAVQARLRMFEPTIEASKDAR